MKCQAGWSTSWNQDCREKYQQPQICRWYSLMAESKDKLKGLWWRWKRKEWKSWLETQHSKTEDHGIRSHHFMANKWRKCGNSVRFRFLGLQNHTYADCSHEIKRHLLLGGKVTTNLDNVLKSRDITLLIKVHIVKAMVLPVVMYGCESWTIKKSEHWRINTFKLWCWRRLLRAPWTARRSNQSILNEINPEYSLEELVLKLKLQ